MKHEEKVTIATSAGVGALAFVFAAIVAHPVVFGAAVFGTYRLGKLAYEKTKKPVTKLNRHNLYF